MDVRIMIHYMWLLALNLDESNNLFYKSNNFTKILNFVKKNFNTTEMIKKRNKLCILVKDVQKIENAVSIFKDLYDN